MWEQPWVWKQQGTLKEQRSAVRIWKTAGNGSKGRGHAEPCRPRLRLHEDGGNDWTNKLEFKQKRKGKSLPVVLKKDHMSEIIPDSSDSVREPSGQTPSAEIPVA